MQGAILGSTIVLQGRYGVLYILFLGLTGIGRPLRPVVLLIVRLLLGREVNDKGRIVNRGVGLVIPIRPVLPVLLLLQCLGGILGFLDLVLGSGAVR